MTIDPGLPAMPGRVVRTAINRAAGHWQPEFVDIL